jgi:hypothetical protein
VRRAPREGPAAAAAVVVVVVDTRCRPVRGAVRGGLRHPAVVACDCLVARRLLLSAAERRAGCGCGCGG